MTAGLTAILPESQPTHRRGFPPDKQAAMARAVRIEWWSIFWLAVTIALMSLVMGGSQAMRTAWIEDCLSLLPPVLFLVTAKLEGLRATRRFPFGFLRTASLAFFLAATALFAFGALLLYEAAATLIRQEHPSIGSVRLLGQEVWLGWLMILVLAYSVVPPVILGRLKQKPAEALADHELLTDADMNKADWQTGLAGILGLLGVAWGFWWADAAAAGLISLSILWDGVGALRTAVAELVDGAPRALHSRELDKEVEALMHRARVLGGQLKLRETGRFITGVLESPDPQDLARLTEDGTSWRVRDLSWRPPGPPA